MSWNQPAAAELSPAEITPEDNELLDRWSAALDTEFTSYAEDDDERRERLDELARATLNLTVCGDVDDTISVVLPCEVTEERPTRRARVAGEPDPMAWLIVRVEAYEPVDLGPTRLTSFSVAIPDHVGPGLYALDELRRRAERDEVEWWGVDDFHLSPAAQGDETTFYLDVQDLDGAWVATTGASIAFDLPMASVVSEIRVAGTITWDDAGGRPAALVQTTRKR